MPRCARRMRVSTAPSSAQSRTHPWEPPNIWRALYTPRYSPIKSHPPLLLTPLLRRPRRQARPAGLQVLPGIQGRRQPVPVRVTRLARRLWLRRLRLRQRQGGVVKKGPTAWQARIPALHLHLPAPVGDVCVLLCSPASCRLKLFCCIMSSSVSGPSGIRSDVFVLVHVACMWH